MAESHPIETELQPVTEDAPQDLETVAKATTYDKIDGFREKFREAIAIEKVKREQGRDTRNDVLISYNDDPKEERLKRLRDEIERMSPVELYCATVSDGPNQLWLKLCNDKEESVDSDQEVAVFKAIFDQCLFGGKIVVIDVLKTNHQDRCDSTCTCAGIGCRSGTSLFHYLATRPSVFLKLAKHPTLRAFVDYQWRNKGKGVFRLQLLCYLFQMLVLTCALAIAARPGLTDAEINLYPAPIDYFRGICEGLLLVVVLANVIGDIVEFIYTPKRRYFQDFLNPLYWSSTIITLTIVPLRILNHPGQWIVASLAYGLHGLKAVEYTSLFRATGIYIYALVIILLRDVSKFVLIFLGNLILFTGTFYLSLRYDDSVFDKNGTLVSGGGLNSDQRNLTGEGREYYEVLFTGLRSLIESGSVLTYYSSNGGFRALSVILYLAFLFVVVIILLNVLIAQMSDTYAKVRTVARDVFLLYQCYYLAKIENQKLANCLLYFFRHLFLNNCHDRKCCGCKNGNIEGAPIIVWTDNHVYFNCMEKFWKNLSDYFVVYGINDKYSYATVVQEIKDERLWLEKKMEQERESQNKKIDELTEQLRDLSAAWRGQQTQAGYAAAN